MSFDNISASIARETTSHKLSLLRSQKQLLSEQLDHLFSQVGECPKDVELLVDRINAVLGLPVAISKEAKATAQDARKFLEHAQAAQGGMEQKSASSSASSSFEDLSKQVQDTSGTKLILTPTVDIYPNDIAAWHRRLEDQVILLTNRTNYAVIFCDTLQEWLETDAKRKTQEDVSLEVSSKSTEQAVRAPTSSDDERSQQTQDFDPKAYLEHNGVSFQVMDKLAELADSARVSGKMMLLKSVPTTHIREAMKSLASDVRNFTPAIRRQLSEEADKSTVLRELRSAFSETWKEIDTAWKWPAEGVKQVLQTHINGKQRFFLDLDVIQAIFLQIVGTTWSKFFSEKLVHIREDKSLWGDGVEVQGLGKGFAVEEARMQMSVIKMATRDQGHTAGGIHEQASARSREKFLQILKLGALGAYDDTDSDSSDDDDKDQWSGSLRAIKTAQAYDYVYRYLSTDIALVKTVDPQANMIALHGDLENFGSSVPHHVVLAVLEFFGMPDVWLKWFKVYLEVPLITQTENGESVVQKQTRGLPFGQSVSALANELLLLLLDLVVAQRTGGLWIHRNHDDYFLHMIDSDRRMDDVWHLMQDFAAQTGLAWNMQKTGCTIIGSVDHDREKADRGLPANPLSWGLLILTSAGEWEVNKAKLATQAQQARQEWDQAQSFLGKVNVLNKYQSFLARNLGPPLFLHGIQHTKMVQTALNDFLNILFDNANGNVNLHEELRKVLHTSFPKHANAALTNGVFIWPTELGGLHLHAHTIHTLLMQSKLSKQTFQTWQSFDEALRQTRQQYKVHKAAWATDDVRRKVEQLSNQIKYGRDPTPEAIWASHLAPGHLPEFVDEESYVRFFALYDASWKEWYYEKLATDIEITGQMYKGVAEALYGRAIAETYGVSVSQGLALIPSELSPSFAVAELNATTKQLYS